MTPSELMGARAAGFSALKLFPAQQAGGVGMLKALGGPFPDVVFCPTGGVSRETAPGFLALPNVACVGGSWVARGSASPPVTGMPSRDSPARPPLSARCAETQLVGCQTPSLSLADGALDRAPRVTALPRKLWELAARRQATHFTGVWRTATMICSRCCAGRFCPTCGPGGGTPGDGGL